MGGRPLCWDRADPEVGEAGLTSLSGLKEGPGGPGGPWGPGGPLGPTPGSPCEQKTQLYQGACLHIGSGWRTAHAPHTHPGYHSPSRPWGPRLLGFLGSPVAQCPPGRQRPGSSVRRRPCALSPAEPPPIRAFVPTEQCRADGVGSPGAVGMSWGLQVGTTDLRDVSPSREGAPRR